MPSTDIVVATSRKDGRDTRFVLADERDLNSCNLHVRARVKLGYRLMSRLICRLDSGLKL